MICRFEMDVTGAALSSDCGRSIRPLVIIFVVAPPYVKARFKPPKFHRLLFLVVLQDRRGTGFGQNHVGDLAVLLDFVPPTTA
jgi:hypothetical protein